MLLKVAYNNPPLVMAENGIRVNQNILFIWMALLFSNKIPFGGSEKEI